MNTKEIMKIRCFLTRNLVIIQRQFISYAIKTIVKHDKNFIFYWQKIDRIKGWLSKDEAFFLYRIASAQSDQIAVEIGSYEGRSTTAIAAGRQGTVYAIDPHTGDRSEVEQNFHIDTYAQFLLNTKEFKNIVGLRSKSLDAARLYSDSAIGFLFIDGWHSEEAVDADINAWIAHCSNQFTCIFDDWEDSEVQNGIIKNLYRLPPFLGAVGKDLVFSNVSSVRKSILGLVLYLQKFDSKFHKFR